MNPPFLISALIVLTSLAAATTQGDPVKPQPGAVPPVQDAVAPVQIVAEAAPVYSARPVKPKAMAQDLLINKGWATGYDPKVKRFIVIGQAPIAKQPGDVDWPDAREDAYTQAMLAAKRSLAEFINLQVSRRIGRTVKKGGGEDSKKTYADTRKEMATHRKKGVSVDSLSMLDKVSFVAHKKMDGYIKDQGYDPDKPESLPEPVLEAAKKLVMTKTFEDRITVAAHGEVAGLAAYQVFESANHIAVIAFYNEGATHRLAAAMLGKGTVERKGKIKSSIAQWARDMMGQGKLSYTHGVRLRTDQNGDLNLVAVGHSTAEYDDPDFVEAAAREAVIAATGELRSFAGEFVDNASVYSRASTTEKLADEARKLETRYTSKKSFGESTGAIAATLKLPGSFTVYEGEYIHPDMAANEDNRITVVSVVTWNLSSAEAAKELGDKMAELGGSKGGPGVTFDSKGKAQPIAGKPKPRVPAGNGSGAGGDDDDFGGGH